MRRSAAGERVAKLAIYGLSALSVCAFFVFAYGTRLYSVSAAGPVEAQAVVAAPAVAAAAAVRSPSAPLAAEAPEPLAPAERIAPYTLAAPQAQQPEAGPLRTVADDSTPPLDEAVLVAEMERVAALGVGLPDTVAPRYAGAFHNTAYCCEVYPHICGGNGVTASGTVPTPGLTAAADWNLLPPGTWLYVEGVGVRRVEDSGSAIKSMRLDIAVDTHANALAWRGFGSHHVWVLEEA
ncbi:MAG: 3D domain-containing protein [Oscillospiraceae bacterium]